ncbi:MAG: FHA domain-containing protein [Solirubrobacteraceae bacterium]
MDSLTSGTLAGTGSFRCEECGFTVTLAAADTLPECPSCGGANFTRASLFGTQRFDREPERQAAADDPAVWVGETRTEIAEPGEYLVFQELGGRRIVSLSREWTRVGRSLAADVRFDDPTVSRRHALIVRQADGVRVLDDRSLNGVFVNGERVEWQELHDGDEIVVGRYRLYFVRVTSDEAAAPSTSGSPLGTTG